MDIPVVESAAKRELRKAKGKRQNAKCKMNADKVR
jgi:hypothetical protein